MIDIVTDDDLLTIAQAVAHQKRAKKGSAITDKQLSKAKAASSGTMSLFEAT
ncbi:MAG: hypothetical protein ACRDCY_10735 [Aeromonas veronii]